MTELVDTRTGEVHSLEPLVQAERMLAAIASVEEALEVIDYAEAARVYAERAGLGINSMNYATAIKVCAEIKLAEVVKTGQEKGEIARQGRRTKTSTGQTFSEIGVTRQRLSEARKMAKQYTPDTIRELAAECNAQEIPLSRKQLLSGEAIQQSLTNEWYTPARYIDAARSVLGDIDLDPASCAEANRTIKADAFFTKDDDGLALPWSGRVWLNPPYGRTAGDFIDRLVDHYEDTAVTSAVALVNAHCTDTRWFQRLWDHALCFTDHRIDFAAGTADRSGSTHGSVFAYLGPDAAVFAREFHRFGAVMVRYA